MSELRTTTVTVTGESEARKYARALVNCSKWFEFTPLPDDQFEFRMKDEGGIPEADTPEALELEARYRTAAQQDYRLSEGDLECDDAAIVSISEDGGAYVEAWIWIDAADIGLCRECGAEMDDGEFDGLCAECADKAAKESEAILEKNMEDNVCPE